MFSGKNLRAMLSSVKAVVVDEVHDLAASERLATRRRAFPSRGLDREQRSASRPLRDGG